MPEQQQEVKMPDLEVKSRDLNSPEAKAEQAVQAKLAAEAQAKGLTVEQLEAKRALAESRARQLREASNFGMINIVRDAAKKKE